jgi:hypothetical protein
MGQSGRGNIGSSARERSSPECDTAAGGAHLQGARRKAPDTREKRKGSDKGGEGENPVRFAGDAIFVEVTLLGQLEGDGQRAIEQRTCVA